MTTKTPIPRQSAKRLAAIKDGTWKPKPRKPLKGPKKPVDASKLLALAFGRSPKGTRSKALKYADKWFSLFIRLRDSDEHGIATCVTSGRRGHWKTMDAGHYISRAKMATRYDPRNAHAQSKQANRFQGGHFLEHGLAVDRIHGPGTRADLELKARMECKRSAADLWAIASHYKGEAERILAEFPGKG